MRTLGAKKLRLRAESYLGSRNVMRPQITGLVQEGLGKGKKLTPTKWNRLFLEMKKVGCLGRIGSRDWGRGCRLLLGVRLWSSLLYKDAEECRLSLQCLDGGTVRTQPTISEFAIYEKRPKAIVGIP